MRAQRGYGRTSQPNARDPRREKLAEMDRRRTGVRARAAGTPQAVPLRGPENLASGQQGRERQEQRAATRSTTAGAAVSEKPYQLESFKGQLDAPVPNHYTGQSD